MKIYIFIFFTVTLVIQMNRGKCQQIDKYNEINNKIGKAEEKLKTLETSEARSVIDKKKKKINSKFTTLKLYKNINEINNTNT
ncbi:MAG: hypothetical protein A2X08_10530 [Bacteroidetes bacterium GWA2_32_17]|nr:MAG: hypothetical protein A2X08_10530 [Bacteroidetes bacterium GWA2_32_17]